MAIEGAGTRTTLTLTSVAKDKTQAAPTPAKPDNGHETSPDNPFSSIRVSLSEMGQARSAAAQRNRDIEQSDLPGVIKELLLRIRELKQQVEQKQQELLALMTSADASSDEVQAKVDSLRNELASLSGALSQASIQLAEAVAKAGLSEDQQRQVATLVLG